MSPARGVTAKRTSTRQDRPRNAPLGADVRHPAGSAPTSARARTLMSGAVVPLDQARDIPADEQNIQGRCDAHNRPDEPHVEPHRYQVIDQPADGQHHHKDCADPNPGAVTDQPPLKGSRFTVPAAHGRRVGHRSFCTMVALPAHIGSSVSTDQRLMSGRSWSILTMCPTCALKTKRQCVASPCGSIAPSSQEPTIPTRLLPSRCMPG